MTLSGTSSQLDGGWWVLMPSFNPHLASTIEIHLVLDC
jgi:hypothetical protein